MSYVRSGPDSDVYIYGSKTSIEVLVAHNRGAKNSLPKKPTPEEVEAYFSDDNSVPFDSPYTGLSFSYTTFSECLAQMEKMRDSGVRIPQSAFDRMRKEQLTSDNYAEV